MGLYLEDIEYIVTYYWSLPRMIKAVGLHEDEKKPDPQQAQCCEKITIEPVLLNVPAARADSWMCHGPITLPTQVVQSHSVVRNRTIPAIYHFHHDHR